MTVDPLGVKPLGVVSAGPGTPPASYLATSSTGSYPHIAVEIDFDTDPGSTPRTWTSVTEYVRDIQWSRGGRQHELQRTDGGTLTAVLDNSDARFDPTNASGPLYGKLKRMRWLRVMAYWDGIEYPRFSGLVETWQQEWPAQGRDATVTIRAADAFKILSLFDLGGQSYSAGLTGARVAAVLATVGLPYAADPGKTTIGATDNPIAVGTSALSHLQDVVESENGLLFADATGQIVFQDRHARLTRPVSLTVIDTIGDAAGEIPYRSGSLDYDDAEVWPTVKVTPEGGTVETAYDATSRTLHFDRVLARTTLSASQAEALNAAQWLSGLYADPAPRIPTVELLPQKDTSKWEAVLLLDNSQRFVWTRRAAATISLGVYVERVSEAAAPGRGWNVSVQLSPAATQSYWILGTAGFTELGDTTRLAY